MSRAIFLIGLLSSYIFLSVNPAFGQTISACVKATNGTLYNVGLATPTCNSGDSTISWGQTGPAGTDGQAGADGHGSAGKSFCDQSNRVACCAPVE